MGPEAEVAFAPLRADKSHAVAAHLGYADALRMQKRFLKATPAYTVLLELAPNNVNGLLGQSTCAIVHNELATAQNLVDRVLTLSPNSKPALALQQEIMERTAHWVENFDFDFDPRVP